MILNTRVFKAGAFAPVSPHLSLLRCTLLCLLLPLFATSPLSAQQGTAISARFGSVKGVVLISTPGGSSKEAHKGDTIRSGTVIECGATAGASLKPLPTLHIIVYPDTKLRFDGADVNGDGGGSVMFTIIAGKALFHIDQPPQGPGDSKPTFPVIKVTVVTDEGVIVNNVGGKPEQTEAGKPGSRQMTAATWTVQHDDGRTVVAVSEGISNVSIGKGAAAGSGDVGGQVKVPQGSVIWLFNRDGKITAELVDTKTGKVTNLTGGPSSGNSLVQQSKNQLVGPSGGGSTSTPGTTPSTPGTLPSNPSSNPDLSTPQKPLPVVSADTP